MNNKKILLLIFCLSVVMTLIWFRKGLLFATAEEGMPFYSPERSAQLFGSLWVDDGTGYSSPALITQFPLMLILKYMNLVISNVMGQAIVFALLIFSGIAGTYLLVESLVRDKKISLISALFYFFNLYAMSQVWVRALFGAMFTWAYLPVFLFLFIKSLKEKRWIWIFLFLFSSLIYSYSYSYLASILVLWVPAGLWVVFCIVTEKKNKERRRLFAKSLILLAVWIIINFWWLYPYLVLSTKAYSAITTPSLSFESLKAVSGNFPLQEILQLKQKFFFNSESNKDLPWGTFYESALTRIITWGGFAIVFWGWIKSMKRKYWMFFTTLLFVGLFISKGTNPPFGFEFFKVAFEGLPFLAILRNSYEKFGLVFLLPYSIFFAYGIVEISARITRPINKFIFLGMVSLAFFGYLVLPLWIGSVFPDYYFVSVPSYYEELSEFLNKDTSDGRVLMAPMLPSHGVRYSWGYRGDEPSRYLFDKTIISRYSNSKYYSEIYSGLIDAFSSKSPNLEGILTKANVKYIVLNYDIDWEAVGAVSPEFFKSVLEGRNSIRPVGKFGNLEAFEYIGNKNFSFIESLGKGAPSLVYKKLSASHYKISAMDSKGDFKLIFKQTFDDYWEAFVENEKIDRHYVIYDYANAWDIDQKGDFEINIKYNVRPWD